MVSFHALNQYLPEELTLLALEWTGRDYKAVMDEVIQDISISKWIAISNKFHKYVNENTIWAGGNHLGSHPEGIIGEYTESHLFNIIDALEQIEIIDWTEIEQILSNVSELGWSLYEAVELIYHYVLGERLDEDGEELLAMYEEQMELEQDDEE